MADMCNRTEADGCAIAATSFGEIENEYKMQKLYTKYKIIKLMKISENHSVCEKCQKFIKN
jgi:hypothetical protein